MDFGLRLWRADRGNEGDIVSKRMQLKKKLRAERQEPGFRASVRNLRVSARKLRLLVDLVRGKDAQQAIDIIRYSGRKLSDQVVKLIQSAVASASQARGVNVDRLYVKKIVVDKAVNQRRFMARARGSADRIIKRSAHLSVLLDQREG